MTFLFLVGGLWNITKAEKLKYRQEIPCRTKSITGGLENEDQHEEHKWSVAGGTAGMHQLVGLPIQHRGITGVWGNKFCADRQRVIIVHGQLGGFVRCVRRNDDMGRSGWIYNRVSGGR